jgi:two-component system, chemotaxis family, sensor kinase CheA
MTNEDIQRIFLQECEEGLEVAEKALIACRDGQQDAETVNSIFRAVHSIKGGAGAFGFGALQAFTHRYETVLQQVRDAERTLDDALLAVLLRAFDTLTDHVAAIRGDAAVPDDSAISSELDRTAAHTEVRAPEDVAAPAKASDDFDFDDLLGALEATEAPTTEVATTTNWIVDFRPAAAALLHGGEPVLLLRDLAALDPALTVEVDTAAVPKLDTFDADESYLGWRITLSGSVARGAIAELFDFLPDDSQPQIHGNATDILESEQVLPCEVQAEAEPVADHAPVAAQAAQPPVDTAPPALTGGTLANPSVRVDLDKLDRLVDTVGELVITQAMLAQRLSGLGAHADDEMAQLDYLTRELQDCAMALRAQPIRSVFSRVPRIVREVEAATGKRVRLEVEGELTELDKTVIERIGEPLTHLIRNAVDHGIELPEDRVAAGKPAEGRVQLSAEHRGGRILIQVKDDGRGIDRARVLAKARDKGIVAADARLTDEEIDHLVFAPGFSTATVVSNISGRGVGMDVVRQNVAALGGRVSITSTPGTGSTFTLALPLTLAIADGMIVAVGGELLVLPLTHVVECLRPSTADVQAFGPDHSMLRIRGQFLPILPLGDALGVSAATRDPATAVLIVVETEARGSVVLMVDAICDQRQVVIKSLETHYRAVEGVAGATILGDGRVAMIIDVEALSERICHRRDKQAAA